MNNRKVTAAELKAALAGEIDQLAEQMAAVMNAAQGRPASIGPSQGQVRRD